MKALAELPGRDSGASQVRRLTSLTESTVPVAPAISTAGRFRGSAQPSGRLIAGRYRLQSLLGRGGMGRVWLAEDELLRRPVALKQYLATDAESEDASRAARARALYEARAAAQVNHRGVVRIHDVVREGSRPWIVMEPLSGRTLAEMLADEGPQPIDRVIDLALRLLDALTAVHQAGVVHRDVKPANVQLCDDGRVVLTDFGIACLKDEELDFPRDVLEGSPAFISPEQLRGERPAPASDLFSLGATLYAVIEGRAPFAKADVWATLTAVVEDSPRPSPRAGRLGAVIEGLLAKEAARRLTADAARAALLALQPQASSHPVQRIAAGIEVGNAPGRKGCDCVETQEPVQTAVDRDGLAGGGDTDRPGDQVVGLAKCCHADHQSW
ncbi:serine/threonine protein kinase [Kribbella orskensis]|uniref:non-specific serine/threonine protein kinase n=1 Tax=Kribbella orskensis TaxID=2512216 RepID=A0ABY2BT64_9ACTN|nr:MULTISPECIES: serine/threonine-protein kinase [Kribbella]TCN44781.1 serine/threonine protein kinase [Kribbella sp. VKM Ac-2500]TCO31441.1 serine/threonine protein kinase [Kribbella orskensis]